MVIFYPSRPSGRGDAAPDATGLLRQRLAGQRGLARVIAMPAAADQQGFAGGWKPDGSREWRDTETATTNRAAGVTTGDAATVIGVAREAAVERASRDSSDDALDAVRGDADSHYADRDFHAVTALDCAPTDLVRCAAAPQVGRLHRISRWIPGAAAALALAACAPAGTAPVGGQGPATSVPGLQMPQLQRPLIQWPFSGGQGAAGQTGTAPSADRALVTDPFAGQGVRQPNIPGGGSSQTAASTPAATAPAATATAPAAARTHTVASGETAWSIARKYGVTIQALAQANGLSEAMTVRSGQRLNIPAGGSAGSNVAAVTAPGTGSPTPEPPSAARPLPDEKTEPASKPAPKTDAPDLGQTRTAASGRGRFTMPASGSIVRAYKKGTNEGIDISAAPGAPIKAAGAGTVAAVTRDTDGVPIVVVRHDGGLMTVYAGIDKLSVGKGDSVKAGQSIGAARNSGVVHFEVRKGFDSVDPEDYL